MADVTGVSSVLASEEISTIPTHVLTKLDERIKSIGGAHEKLKVDYEVLRVNSEQQYSELERQLVETQKDLDNKSNAVTELTHSVADLTNQLTSLKAEAGQKEELSSKLRRENEALRQEKDLCVSERKEFILQLEEKSKKIEHLSIELKTLTEQIQTSNKAKCEALAKVDELQSKEISVEYREKQLQHEKVFLNKQIELLKNDLTSRNNDLMEIRRDHTTRVVSLQAELSEKTDELRLAKQSINDLTSTTEEQATRIEKLMERLREAHNAETKREEQYRQEIRAQSRLASIYNESREDAEKKSNELISAVEELQKLLNEASEKYGDLETKFAQAEIGSKEILTQRNEAISILKKELDDANDLLSAFQKKGISDEIESIMPTAASVSKLLKSGMTLSQIYTQYVSVSEELLAQKEDNKKLNSYLEHILHEIEEKAPILKKQRSDHENNLETIAVMTRQREDMIAELESVRLEADSTSRRFNQLKHENAKLSNEARDLSKQVCLLLRQIEELRGRPLSESTEATGISSEEITSSSELITEKLVTFRDVEELQQQNRNLISAVRELSTKHETSEKEAVDQKTADLKEQLDKALEELEKLKQARTRQEHMVNSIVRQRDMYRVLLQQQGPSVSPEILGTSRDGSDSSNEQAAPPVSPTDVKLAETQAALKQLKEEYENYRKEKAENDKMSYEHMEKLRDDLSTQKTNNAKLSSQIEYHEERFKVLQTNMQSYKRQLSSLEEKCQSYSATVLKHEQTNSKLREEVLVKNQKLSQAEVSVEHLQQEKALLKSSETRLLQERELLLREQRNQGLLMANLEAIKNNLERSDATVKIRLENQVDTWQRECQTLRRQLAAETEKYQETVKMSEKNTADLIKKLETETERSQKTRDELVNAYAHTHALQQELAEAQAQLRNNSQSSHLLRSPRSLASGQNQGETTEMNHVRDLQAQLHQSLNKIKSLEAQLTAARQHLDQYKSIADGVEKQLQESNEASQIFRETMEKRVQDLEETEKKLQEQIAASEKEKADLVSKNESLSSERTEQSGDLRKQLETVQLQLQESIKELGDANRAATEARADLDEQIIAAQEAQNKYEHELMLHAADVQALNVLKQEASAQLNKNLELEVNCKKLEETLTESKTHWQERERLLKAELEQNKQQVDELNALNASLQDQMLSLSTQVSALRDTSSLDSSRVSLNTSFTEDEARTSEQLLQLIKFLRREKNISESKMEIYQAENNRLKSSCEYLGKQLEDTKQTLSSEREKSQVSAVTSMKHAELLRKLETLNALTDSNRLLREESDSANSRCRELSARVETLEKDIQPLQEKNRNISSQNDTLAAENQALRNEVTRWRARTNALVEKANKTSPEDFKKMQTERDALQKQCQQVNEELRKLHLETTRLNQTITSNQQQIQRQNTHFHQVSEEKRKLSEELQKVQQQQASLQEEIASVKTQEQKSSEELTQLRADLSKIEFELNDTKNKELQVRKIARKYKGQCEEQRAEIEQLKEMKEKADQAAAAGAEGGPSEVLKQDTEAKIKESEEKCKDLNEQLTRATAKVEEFKKLNESLRNAMKDKSDRMKQAMKNANERLNDSNEKRKKLEAENAELKGKLEAVEQNTEEESVKLTAIRSQYEGRVNRLEKDNATVQQDRERLTREIESANQRLAMQQRQLEHYQKQLGSQQGKPSTSSTEKTLVEPPTANIRPMTGPTPPPTKPQPVSPAVTIAPSQRATPLASIRPMSLPKMVAVLPTSMQAATATQGVVSPAPIHTSEPSHSSASFIDPLPSTSSGIPQISVHPLPVARHSEAREEISGDAPLLVTVMPITSEPVQQATEVVESSDEMPQAVALVSPRVEQMAETSGPPVVSSSGPSTSGSEVQGKRTHEVATESGEEEAEDDEPQPKRVRTSSGAFDVNDSVEEVTEGDTQDTEQEECEGDDEDVIVLDSDDDETRENTGETVSGSYDEEDDEDDDVEEEEEEDEEDDEDKEMDEYDEGMEADQGYEGEECEDQNSTGGEGMDIGESAQVVDIEEGSSHSAADRGDEVVLPDSAPVSASNEDNAAADATLPTRPSAVPAGGQERLPSFGRQQQLAPFPSLSSQFEEAGDDSIVPSTPTLFVPRRTDGFAEAVSSPHVPGRFLFSPAADLAAPVSGTSGLAHLASQGMDDTRIDLSQFDEGSGTGRSVPTTPLQVSPPTEVTSSEIPGDNNHSAIQEVPTTVESQSSVLEEGENSSGIPVPVPAIAVVDVEEEIPSSSEIDVAELSANPDDESPKDAPVTSETSSLDQPRSTTGAECSEGIATEDVTSSLAPGSPAETLRQTDDNRSSEQSEGENQNRAAIGRGRARGASGPRRLVRERLGPRPTPIVWNEPSGPSSPQRLPAPQLARRGGIRQVRPVHQQFPPQDMHMHYPRAHAQRARRSRGAVRGGTFRGPPPPTF